MHTRIAILTVITLAIAAPSTAGEASVTIPEQYRVEPPRFPCPNQSREETAALAHRMSGAGWKLAGDGALAIVLDLYLVYANFSSEAKAVSDGNRTTPFPPKTSGWVPRAPSFNAS